MKTALIRGQESGELRRTFLTKMCGQFIHLKYCGKEHSHNESNSQVLQLKYETCFSEHKQNPFLLVQASWTV
jgi:hypothetical protein